MIRIVGTGHIFEKSVRDVEEAIERWSPGIVAVELDPKRFRALEEHGWDLEARGEGPGFFPLLKQALRGGSFLVLLEGLLAKIQQDLGQRFGIRPGSDMVTAIKAARKSGAKVALIDRDIDVTLNHILSIPLREKIKLFSRSKDDMELISGLMGSGIESLLEEENIERVMVGLGKNLPTLYAALVGERDGHMALALKSIEARYPGEDIVAVVGAGHKRGLCKCLEDPGKIKKERIGGVRPVSRLQLLLLIIPIAFLYVCMRIRFALKR